MLQLVALATLSKKHFFKRSFRRNTHFGYACKKLLTTGTQLLTRSSGLKRWKISRYNFHTRSLVHCEIRATTLVAALVANETQSIFYTMAINSTIQIAPLISLPSAAQKRRGLVLLWVYAVKYGSIFVIT